MNNDPVISIIMPVYNAEKFLAESIDSILKQTFSDFEFIIINDGSTDESENEILKFSDSRIVYIKNEKNLKIVKTLNKGLSLARGKFIARMDADDFSFHNRLEVQHSFLLENPEVDVVGSNFLFWQKNEKVSKLAEKDEDIKAQMFFSCSMAHPTIMARRTFYEKYKYREEYDKAEDYELWVRSMRDVKFANIKERLLKYRIHPNQSISDFQKKQAIKIQLNIFKELLNRDDLFDVYQSLCTNSFSNVNLMICFYELICIENDNKRIFKKKAFEKEVINRIWGNINTFSSLYQISLNDWLLESNKRRFVLNSKFKFMKYILKLILVR